jgi:Na+-translocating ferredoxin:NAD+ oxidoreductase subunit D
MREFFVNNGPHIRDENSTSRMMRNLLFALLPLILFACYKNGFKPYFAGYGTLFDAFKPVLMIVIAMITSLLCEIVSAIVILRKKEDHLKEYLKYSYGLFPGLFLALTLPINVSLPILMLGCVVATVVGKMIFGGFGKNVFNPALVGNLFIMTFFYSDIASNGGFLNKLEIDTISSATPLSHIQGLNYISSYNQAIASFGDIWHFITGFIPGSLGETSKILCVLALIYLIFTKVIKWRIPIVYITTVFVLTMIIGYYNGLSIWFPIFHILSGGLLFGAIFMATDPVTSPTTSYGQVLFGLLLGMLTVIFRFLFSYPEGVLTAILLMNMMVFILDKIGSRVKFNYNKGIIPIVIVITIMVASTMFIANNVSAKRTVKDTTFNIIDKVKANNITTYTVTQKGFHGLIKAIVTIDANGKISSINIISQNETVWDQIVSNNYMDKIINNQNDLTKLDTISGATYTSNYLKQLTIKVLNDYSGKNTILVPTNTNSGATKNKNNSSNEKDDEDDEEENDD